MCQQMVVDHAVCNPMALLWPAGGEWPVRIVPVEINTVQFPFPSAARCYEFGKAIGRAVAAYPEGLRVVVIGTGGLSHQLDGERAGCLNRRLFLSKPCVAQVPGRCREHAVTRIHGCRTGGQLGQPIHDHAVLQVGDDLFPVQVRVSERLPITDPPGRDSDILLQAQRWIAAGERLGKLGDELGTLPFVQDLIQLVPRQAD